MSLPLETIVLWHHITCIHSSDAIIVFPHTLSQSMLPCVINLTCVIDLRPKNNAKSFQFIPPKINYLFKNIWSINVKTTTSLYDMYGTIVTFMLGYYVTSKKNGQQFACRKSPLISLQIQTFQKDKNMFKI